MSLIKSIVQQVQATSYSHYLGVGCALCRDACVEG